MVWFADAGCGEDDAAVVGEPIVVDVAVSLAEMSGARGAGPIEGDIVGQRVVEDVL